MKAKSLIGLAVGVAVICLLFVWKGLETVLGLLAEAGWGTLLVCLFAPPSLFLCAEAWRRLFPPGRRPKAWRTFWAASMGSSINSLLPTATIGGEVVKARLMILWSSPATDAVSTVIVDKTAQAIGVLVWALVGIVMLAAVAPDERVVWWALAGAAVLGLGISGFILVQVVGGFSLLARFLGGGSQADKWRGLVDGAEQLDAAIRAIYRRPWAIAGAVALRLGDRLILVGEILLAAWLMGHPLGLGEAILLKGLVVGIRGVGFFIPAGIGIQEGGFIAIGALVGLPAELMIAVSLATRIREILPSIPLLLAWQHIEGRALWRRHRRAAEGDS